MNALIPAQTRGYNAAPNRLVRMSATTFADRGRPASPSAFLRQREVIKAWGEQLPLDLCRIRIPVLMANGDHDIMAPTTLSRELADRLPDARLVIYRDAGHGSIFQYPAISWPASWRFYMNDLTHCPLNTKESAL